MQEPYRRPDRAEIAARVHAELAAQQPSAAVTAEQAASDCAGPGTARELATGELTPQHAVPEPETTPDDEDQAPPPPPARCRTCKYPINSIGHWWACHG